MLKALHIQNVVGWRVVLIYMQTTPARYYLEPGGLHGNESTLARILFHVARGPLVMAIQPSHSCMRTIRHEITHQVMFGYNMRTSVSADNGMRAARSTMQLLFDEIVDRNKTDLVVQIGFREESRMWAADIAQPQHRHECRALQPRKLL